MIDSATALKVQARLDGELSVAEAGAVARLLEQDAQARAVDAELRQIRGLLAEHQPEHVVPETREFYWSRIQREIERETAVSEPRGGGSGLWWLKWLGPVAGTGLVGLFLLQGMFNEADQEPALAAFEQETETTLADATSFSFRSESEGMTVVWVQTGRFNDLGSGE
jgi:anti-sigma factor RsiW